MADRFNPITDLQPADPFNVPVGESSEEVESIRVKLIVTRNKTKDLVNLLQKKNISFKKDIDTIRELNRRLMRTIPRIPILRGDASSQTNRLEEISKRRGQFDIDTTLIPKPTAKVRQRLLNFAFDVILFFFGGRIFKGIFKLLGFNKLKNPVLIKKLNDLLKKSDVYDDLIKVRPGKKITPNPLKRTTPLEISKVFAKNNVNKVTKDVRNIANQVQNELSRKNVKNSVVLEKANEAITKLNKQKFDLLENFGKIVNPTKTQVANQNQLIQEIDKAILKVNGIRNLPQFTPIPLSKSGNNVKTLQEIFAESENFPNAFKETLKKPKFSNTQLDRETNIFFSGEKFYNDYNQYINSSGSALDKKLFESLKMRTGKIRDIFIVD